ncbi:MAG: DUF29 domain-containing protein [Methylococcales bacterium]|nr:DUF29 domain-containing protein [Methylococcales bacterium]
MINYDKDFYGWTQEQALMLRAGRLQELDIENLIDEIESMGRSEKRELQSRLTVLLVHLLKWHYQASRRGRSWDLTIIGQRLKLESVIKDSPGLKPQLPEILSDAYRIARVDAAKETGLDIAVFLPACPWTYEQITDDSFYPE